MDEFKRNVDSALSEAEKMTGEQITGVSLALAGPVIDVSTSTGTVAVLQQQEVREEDVSRAMDMAQSGLDLTNRTVVKVVPESFVIDHQASIKNPVGMSAKKLEVKAHVFSMGTNILSNIKKGIYDVGVNVVDVYPGVISAAEAVLSRRQRELGVVCIDIGASTTGIAVYEEGSLIFSSMIGVGGEHVTADIALGMRISIDLAEKLKIEHGEIGFGEEERARDEEIELSRLVKTETGTVSKKFLAEIIGARYREIFFLVNAELKKIRRDGMLPEGAVLSGGGAKMRNVLDLARQTLRLPAVIGVPQESEFVSGTSVADPVFASVIGTILLSHRYASNRTHIGASFSVSGFWSSIKNTFRKILP